MKSLERKKMERENDYLLDKTEVDMLKPTILILLAFTLSSTSCKDSSINTDNQSLGKIVFENEYMNYAWGYVRNGNYVAEDGKVYSYDLGKTNIQVKDSSDGYYFEEELLSKYHHYDTLRLVIPKDTILWAYNLALLVNPNTYSDTSRTGADMGLYTYSIYLYRSEKKKYQKIILNQEGDWHLRNISESAVELTKWFGREKI
jgi:hypothetical protein